MKEHCTAVILAAGRGTRMGTQTAKQYLELQGKPILAYALEIFEQSAVVDDILLMTDKEQDVYKRQELISQLNKQSERVIFLGDGVPVYQGMIREKMTVPYVFAPAQMNRQRASCVAALGMKALNEGYTGVKVQPADEFVPDYLRKSQAERQREAENSPDGQAGKLPGDY